jgi:hypothetical protein
MSKSDKTKRSKTTITIAKRQPGKAQKTNFMQNLRPFPTEFSHPVEELLGLTKPSAGEDSQIGENMDTQNTQVLGALNSSILDTQKQPINDTPNASNLDTQNTSFLGAHTDLVPDTQNKLIPDTPIPQTLDTQKLQALDTQNVEYTDTQTVLNADTQIIKNLDTQNIENATLNINISERPENQHLNTQKLNSPTPKASSLEHPETISFDTQTKPFGRSEISILGTSAPKHGTEAPKKSGVLGAEAPREKVSGTRTNKKGKYDYKKYDANRSTVRVNLHIDREIDKKVRQYCLVDSQPKVDLKDFYERAALMLLEHLDTQKEKGLGAEAPLDDRRLKMLYKTNPTIINLYLSYNSAYNEIVSKNSPGKWKAKWTSKDDEFGRKFNETDIRIIELGILQTQVNKGLEPNGSKIQTFKYYVDEIEKVKTAGISNEMLDTILQYHRQIWKNLAKREVDLAFLEENKTK